MAQLFVTLARVFVTRRNIVVVHLRTVHKIHCLILLSFVAAQVVFVTPQSIVLEHLHNVPMTNSLSLLTLACLHLANVVKLHIAMDQAQIVLTECSVNVLEDHAILKMESAFVPTTKLSTHIVKNFVVIECATKMEQKTV
jgi:hypothetical protein